MIEIELDIRNVKRTEHKDWDVKKVKNLVSLLSQGNKDFVDQPVFVVKDRYGGDEYFVYDGNTRHFLAENEFIELKKFYLMETDSDLEDVRNWMQDIYWPGENLDMVTGTLSTRAYYLEELQRKAA